jgi:hypothetical protein
VNRSGEPTPAGFTLTEWNAVEAGSYAIGSVEEALSSGVIAANVGIDLWLRGVTTDASPACGPASAGEITSWWEDRDNTASMTNGDVIRFRHAECFGVRRDISLTVTFFDPRVGRIDGRVKFDNSREARGFAFTGAYRLLLTWDAVEARWGMTDAALTTTWNSQPQSVRVSESEIVVDDTSYRFTAKGSVDSAALGGAYMFEIPIPLAGNSGALPASGNMLLSTTTGSRAVFMPPAEPVLGEETLDYQVAAPRSEYAPAHQTRWSTLVRGALFGWRPNSAPTISELRIQPENPAPGAPLQVSYQTSDADGDAVAVEITWYRNGQVVANNTKNLSIATVRNDLIEVIVKASDGRATSPTVRTASVTVANRPPSITSLSITPSTPGTTSDIVAVAAATDPDGDPLTASYVWLRNGEVLQGRTTAVVPASETTRGDELMVTVTFSDDGLSVSRTATVTIVDSAPRVAVAMPPASATYGMPVTFTATVSDVDGDPVSQIRYKIAFGPTGMTIDPMTGVVTWTPTGPMFDRTLDVNWGITVVGDYAYPATGTTRVEDPDRDYPLLRTGMRIPLLDALQVGDFDGDGDTEMLLLGVRWLLEIEADGAGGYRQSWAYPFVFDVDDEYSPFGRRRALTTGDVDGDDAHEIFVTADNRLIKLDGVERRIVASVDVDERCIELEYGDVDDDGEAEIVCTALVGDSSERLIVYRASDLSVRASLPAAPYGLSLALGNVDADRALEIVTSGGYVIDGASNAVQWHHAAGFANVAIGNLDGSGPDEIVAMIGYERLGAYRANVATPLFDTASASPDTVLVADLDGDSRAEILTGDNQWGNVTAHRYVAGSGTTDIVFQINSQDHGVSALGVGDLDGDSQREIVWGTGLSSSGADKLVVAGLNPGIEIEWTNTDPVQIDGPFSGGALARSPTSPPAPLFLTPLADSGYGGSRLVRLDPVDGTILISSELDSTQHFSTLNVDDYDADGTDEALLGTRYPYTAVPTVYDFHREVVEWTGAPPETTVYLTSGDVYGDGRDELVSLSDWYGVSVVNVSTGQVVWWGGSLPRGAVSIRIVDLEGDGSPEIAALVLQGVYIFEPTAGSPPFVQGISMSASPDVAIGDTDGDGRAEIIWLVENRDGPATVFRRDPVDARMLSAYTLPWPAQSIAIEPSQSARKNLLVSRVEGEFGAGRLATVDPRTGAVISESPPLIGAITEDSVHFVDVSGSGDVRLSIGTEAGMYLTR